jgi:hypothetical protein
MNKENREENRRKERKNEMWKEGIKKKEKLLNK